jgi:hypothetical protein
MGFYHGAKAGCHKFLQHFPQAVKEGNWLIGLRIAIIWLVGFWDNNSSGFLPALGVIANSAEYCIEYIKVVGDSHISLSEAGEGKGIRARGCLW